MKFDFKFDIKTILILVLLGFSLIFFYKWYFGGSDSYKEEVDKLRKENKIIQQKRDSIDTHLRGLEIDFKNLKSIDSTLRNRILDLDKEIVSAKSKANHSKEQLDELRKELEHTKKEIEDLKKEPKNRQGDDLLNSLKNKTKK